MSNAGCIFFEGSLKFTWHIRQGFSCSAKAMKVKGSKVNIKKMGMLRSLIGNLGFINMTIYKTLSLVVID
jgi:hypothetical protein